MGKVIEEYTSQYDVGDVIIFSNSSMLFLGIIEGYYIDHNCNFFHNAPPNHKKGHTYPTKISMPRRSA